MWFGFSIPHVMIIMIFVDTEAVIIEATSALDDYIVKLSYKLLVKKIHVIFAGIPVSLHC